MRFLSPSLVKSTVYFQENGGWLVVNGNIVAERDFFWESFKDDLGFCWLVKHTC